MATQKPQNRQLPAWWGEMSLAIDEARTVLAGPLTLIFKRFAQEWQIDLDNPLLQTYGPLGRVAKQALSVDAGQEARVERYRFVMQSPPSRLMVRPALADRAVVCRPVSPLVLPPQQHIQLFLSTPLWLQVYQPDKAGKAGQLLLETSLSPNAETWFGPDTLTGELCYMVQTCARLSPDAVSAKDHYATTPIRLHNDGDDELVLERLNVPVPHLGLSICEKGRLWTPEVNYRCTQDSNQVEFKIMPGVSALAKGAQEMAPPRTRLRRQTMVRAWKLLFG